MGRSQKYTDFRVSEPFVKEAKHGRGETRAYVTIHCPHCNEVFAEVANDIIGTQKAKECLGHLRGDPTKYPPVEPCRAALAAGVVVSGRREPTADAVREQTAVMQAQHAESMAVHVQQLASQRRSEAHLKAICSVLGLSDHSSDDEDGSKVAARAKRKVETLQSAATLDTFDRVAKAGRFSPPRDDEPPVAVGKRVVECVTAVAADACKVAGLRSQLAAVDAEVDVGEGAPPAARMKAIHALKTTISDRDRKISKADEHFQKVSNAAGRSHESLHDQVEHVKALKNATAAATVAPPSDKQVANKHLNHIDNILGLTGRPTQTTRIDELKKLKRTGFELGIHRHKEANRTKQLKSHLAANKQLTRHMTASKNLMPDGWWKDTLMECIPTSGNDPDDTFHKSGTRHA